MWANPLAFFGLGTTELAIIAIVALLLFGPMFARRLPGMMRGLGQGLMELRKGVRELEEPDDE